MAELLALWHAEHAKFARLLTLLEQQLQRIREDERPDYELVGDILDYLIGYADACHHPREDIGFARLVQKDPRQRGLVGRLAQEHRVIGEAGRELRRLVNEVSADVLVPRGQIEAAASTYLVYYRHHIELEERRALKRAAELFDAADWAAIAARFAQIPDPLEGDDTHARFADLRRRIHRDSGRSQRRIG